MIIFTYLFSNTCKKRLAYWFGLHSLHKLDLWQVFCILLNFAYFQQQNTGTYRSKFNFFSVSLEVIANENDSKLCIKEIFVFFRVEYSINKLVKTFAQNYHTFFQHLLFVRFTVLFYVYFFYSPFFQLSNADRCLHHASTEVFLYFKFYINKACILLFKKSEYRRILYLSGIKNSFDSNFFTFIRLENSSGLCFKWNFFWF